VNANNNEDSVKGSKNSQAMEKMYDLAKLRDDLNINLDKSKKLINIDDDEILEA